MTTPDEADAAVTMEAAAARLRVAREIISMYHTTRLGGDGAEHVMTKVPVQRAFDALARLAATPPPASAGEVEAVARAICESTGLRWDDQKSAMTSGGGNDDEQEGYRVQALAAIAAMSPRVEVPRNSEGPTPSSEEKKSYLDNFWRLNPPTKPVPWQPLVQPLGLSTPSPEKDETIAALRADLQAAVTKEVVGACEACSAPLFDGDNICSDPEGIQGCWHAMTDVPDTRNRPCYAYRVGKQSAAGAVLNTKEIGL